MAERQFLERPTEDSRIQLLKTAFVTYYHTDLQKARHFLIDFGLPVAYEEPGKVINFQGYGSEPYGYVAHQFATGENYFGGAAYITDSYHGLERAVSLPSSTGAIQDLIGPAGGKVCTLQDPCGHKVHLVHGWREKQSSKPGLPKLTFNFEDEKPRKGEFQRFQHGPAPVFRWGHYGVSYPEGKYDEMYEWYTRNLSLAPSDIVYAGDKPAVCFFHLDRGETYIDHHSFYFKPARPSIEPSVTHSAFEVRDFDV